MRYLFARLKGVRICLQKLVGSSVPKNDKINEIDPPYLKTRENNWLDPPYLKRIENYCLDPQGLRMIKVRSSVPENNKNNQIDPLYLKLIVEIIGLDPPHLIYLK